MSRRGHIIYWAAIVVLLILLGRQRGEVSSLLEKLRQADAAESSARIAAKKQEREILSLRDVVSQLGPASSDAAFEDALGLWISKVHRLSAYLEKHPNLRIPQMAALSASNWLDVTRDNALVSDADFRAALGRLRGLARQATAADIGKALSQVMSANGGQVPANPQELAPYLPPGVHPAILGQLQTNPSGSIPGLRDLGGAGPQQYFVLDAPVDLWDSTLFYNPAGAWGSRSIGQGAQAAVVNAIAQFTQATGAAPTDVSQLITYSGISSMNPSDLNEIFQAVTTKPP